MSESLNHKVVKSTKWSAITEVVSKLVHPVVSMLLARLLTPEAFGVVTTLAIVTSFAGIFTDAGFHKYLVQHEYRDKEDLWLSAHVAFWSNLLLSLLLWSIIIVFADPLAALVGSPGLGHVLIIASSPILLGAFASIQSALYKRDLDFKTLFKVRTVSVFIPFVATVPLAFWLRSYWALVIGGIVQSMVGAILLTIYSNWKPQFYFSFQRLREMFSFSVWSVVEAVSIWLTFNVDIFIVSTMLSQYYLGLYKTSITVVSQIIGIVTAASTPILFSALSRLQSDNDEFQRMFSRFQKVVGMLVIPMGIGIFCFSDLITIILLGDQWTETSGFIGLWGLTSSLVIVLSQYSCEVYRAKGHPKLSVLSQWLHIIAVWPAVLIAVKYGFHTLYVARSAVRLESIVVDFAIMYYVLRISPLKMLLNIWPSIIASIPILFIAYHLKQLDNSIGFQLVTIIICSLTYFMALSLFRDERHIIWQICTKRHC